LAEEPIVIVADLPLGLQRLLPAPLQGPGHEAILRIDGPVAPFGVLGLVAGPLQPLPPVLVQAGAGPPGGLQGPTGPLQRGGLQGAKDLLSYQVVDRRGPEAEAGLLASHVQMAGTPVVRLLVGPIVRLEAPAAVAADDDAGEQRRAVARTPLGAGPPSVL